MRGRSYIVGAKARGWHERMMDIIWAGQRLHFEPIEVQPTTEDTSEYTPVVDTSASALGWIYTVNFCKKSDKKFRWLYNSNSSVLTYSSAYDDPIRRYSSKNEEIHSPSECDVGIEGSCGKLCQRKFQKRIGKTYRKLKLTGDIDTLFNDQKIWFIWGGSWLSLTFTPPPIPRRIRAEVRATDSSDFTRTLLGIFLKQPPTVPECQWIRSPKISVT